MRTVFEILTYFCIVIGLILTILNRDIEFFGYSVILGTMFWSLDFYNKHKNKK